ncbi:U1 small nuclear ribonucleoprotein 70 kDa-like [Hydractinia symbiolongicarpus]|uniref:U1 small nuclear ribonucleoprotein 70 kDa-like n=1 Tax=Hydractinia symbiolongicarpus TaxID=13093 RepID=UPI00254F77AC|nr:U1 small nuclear ribonucleoprotein 70 kDa-like [Hydractinia symbiolongicarpus]
MTQYLPPNLLALFSARPPILFKPPVDRLKRRKNAQPIAGIAEFLSEFEKTEPPPATRGETREEKEQRKQREKNDIADNELQEKILKWDPHNDPNATGDPFKTLFVGRINYDTSENKLRREMEDYGPVRRIHLVYNVHTRKPRGYAFVEFEHERDMHSAYKHIDGKRIDNKRIVVDVERGRTVKSWRPRRLGGGLGGTRRGGESENIKHSGRVENWEGSRNRDRGDRERERSDRGDRDREERRERRRSRSPRGDRDRDRERRRRERDERDGDRDRRERRGRDREERDSEREREKKDRGDRDTDRDRERDRERDRDRKERERDRDRDRERNRDDYRSGREEDGEIRNDEYVQNGEEEEEDEKKYVKQEYESSKQNRYDDSNGYEAAVHSD